VLIVGRCRHSWALVCGVVLGHVRRSWGGAGSGLLSSLFLGWCWAIVVIPGVVLGHCRCSWGGAGSSSPMLGVVMGHSLGGWWWTLVAVCVDTLPLRSIIIITCHCRPSVVVVLCWVEIGQQTMIVHCLVATLLTWHLAPGLANSKGEGGLTSSLSIVWRPRHRLQCGNSGSHHCCLTSMWLVVRLVTWHCDVGRRVMVVGDQRGGWWVLWVAASKR